MIELMINTTALLILLILLIGVYTISTNISIDRYYAKAFKKDLGQAVDILSDILTHSKFDPAAIEEERHVIMREMEEVEKSHEEVIFDRLHMTAYRDSPLGFTILGPPENIQTLTRDHILSYIGDNYTADRLVR